MADKTEKKNDPKKNNPEQPIEAPPPRRPLKPTKITITEVVETLPASTTLKQVTEED